MKYVFVFLSVVGIFLSGCRDPLRVGSKEFTEQLILAEIIAQLAEHQGVPVKRMIPYGDTLNCIEGLKENDLDVYVEYSGTGLLILGQPPLTQGDKSFAMVQDLYSPMKLEWKDRFGFANNYILVVKRDYAQAHNLKKISDLVKLEDQVKFGCDKSFPTRPLDGYAALLRRYGITSEHSPVLEDDKSILYHSLLDEKINVAVGYSTDGQIEVFNLVALQDDLGFFPVYEAAPLVRQEALKKHPSLESILDSLAGRIDTEKMREMNRQVELDGESYKTVASQFIEEEKLVPANSRKKKTSQELVVAIENLDELGGMAGKAQRAIRKTFPGRRLNIVRTAKPGNLVIKKEARIALMGAESFFTTDENDFLAKRISGLEAIAPVGYRMCHVLVHKDSSQESFSQVTKIGAGLPQSSSHRITKALLRILNMKEKATLVTGSLTDLSTKLKNKKIEALVLMVAPGNSKLTSLLREGNFKLLSLEEITQHNFQFKYPFLRLARIPINTYPQQMIPLETVSCQVVLVGPAAPKDFVGDVGPVSISYQQPLSESSVRKINQELGGIEPVDPILPVGKALKQKSKRRSQSTIGTSYEASFINFVVILSLIYLFYLFLKEDE